MAKRRSLKSLLAGTVVTAVLAILAILSVVAASFIWTEFAWFESMGLASVFSIRIVSQGAVWAIGSLVAFAIMYASSSTAQRLVEGGPGVRRAALWSSLLLAVGSSWNLSTNWMVFRLAVAGPAFGSADPLFGRDIGFFVFQLPAFEIASRWLSGILVLSIVLVLGIVFVPTLFGVGGEMKGKWWRFKTLASVFVGLILLSAAFTYWVSIWRLVYSTRTQFFGAGYTDVHAQLPANIAVLVVTLIAAIVVFATARSRSWKAPMIAIGAWAGVSIVFAGLWPALMQNYVVRPNEATLELPYIERNIELTRAGFDLDAITAVPYAATPTATAELRPRAAESLSVARLWTANTAAPAYDQLQTIRPYYRMSTLDTDRYEIDGKRTQVLASAREVDTSGLPKPARTWVNKHIVYTHGFGTAVSVASDASNQGFPQFVVGNVPPQVAPEVAEGSPSLEITEPRIYFGINTSDYVFVDTRLDEFDYPRGEKNATYRYKGTGGVRFGSGLGRLAWTIRFGSSDVLFSRYMTPDSRVMIYRGVTQRAKRLAPWLTYEKKPYAAIVDGRIVWILDAYTSSDHFPYSQPLKDGTNYLRDSVKVVVDAYTGETTFYAVGEDPIRDAWAKIFPDVLTPVEQAPESLVAHFRASKRVFEAQADVFRAYHMTDPTVFYNKEDQWETPAGADGDASYLMLDLADSQPGPNLYLLQPYTPAGRDNLIGWMATACDPADYGKSFVLLLPKERSILGPRQARARINQDPTISPQLSLWDQHGSSVTYGAMLSIPAQRTVSYIQPIFLQSKDSAMTQLIRVIVVNGDEVEMAPTLDAALQRVFGDEASPGTRLRALLEEALSAQQQGDEDRYNEIVTEIEDRSTTTSSTVDAQ